MINKIKQNLNESKELFIKISEDGTLINKIIKCTEICVQSLKSGGKIIFCGNGGSAAESQHFAAELVSSLRECFPHVP